MHHLNLWKNFQTKKESTGSKEHLKYNFFYSNNDFFPWSERRWKKRWRRKENTFCFHLLTYNYNHKNEVLRIHKRNCMRIPSKETRKREFSKKKKKKKSPKAFFNFLQAGPRLKLKRLGEEWGKQIVPKKEKSFFCSRKKVIMRRSMSYQSGET